MKDIKKYQGVIPAFYACYDAEGNISTEGVKALTRHLIAKGVKGVYVGGSSGECIYQHVDERKAVLEAVMSEAKGKLTVIAHVGCNNTADSVELARHAEAVRPVPVAAHTPPQPEPSAAQSPRPEPEAEQPPQPGPEVPQPAQPDWKPQTRLEHLSVELMNWFDDMMGA